MAASGRSLSKAKKISKEKIETLPVTIKNHILTFFGKIGTKDFKYSSHEFKDNAGQSKYPTFPGNLLVLCSYMERANLAAKITFNLLHHIEVEQMLVLADQNKKCLPIPVLVQDPFKQWIEANAIQAMYAAGDRDPPNMSLDEKPFGLVERVASCYENPAYANQHIEEWRKGSEKATKETMTPYIMAIDNICQEIIECKEISDNISWAEVLVLPVFLQMDKDFSEALKPNSTHIVRSGFLFSMEIFLHLIKTFEKNINNDNVEDKSRPTLGGWYSNKSDVLDAIVYPKLQARSSRCDLGLFKCGIVKVLAGQLPERLDFSKGDPVELTGIGSTHFFGFYGDKYHLGRGNRGKKAVGGAGLEAAFSTLVLSKNNSNCTNHIHPATTPAESSPPHVRNNVKTGNSRAAKRRRL